MRPKTDKALLIKYFEGKCTADEQQQVARYLANAEYPESLDALLEEEWKNFKTPDDSDADGKLAQRLFEKFNNKINPKN